jgi:hypothetical protein
MTPTPAEPSTVRTVAVHDVVQQVYPRPPPTERDDVGRAEGKAIDAALNRFSYDAGRGGRPSVSSVVASAETIFREELRDAQLSLDPAAAESFRSRVRDLARLFRQSELAGQARPRTRLLVIDGDAGIYAQPDFWDGRARIFELKSYRAIPPPPDVTLQLELFQLAFPGFEERLVCLDRHATPPSIHAVTVGPIAGPRRLEVLTIARDVARAHGTEKVLRFVDSPIVRRSTGA